MRKSISLLTKITVLLTFLGIFLNVVLSFVSFAKGYYLITVLHLIGAVAFTYINKQF